MSNLLLLENPVLSNNQIKKLGERIRQLECKKEKCSLEDLQHLQNFRLSFKDSLNEIFHVLSEESKQVHKNRIVSFRMKKIDTIFSKLNREKGMDLERMGDIAGCRCIVHSESAIYKIIDRLNKSYDLKINDKIGIPDEDGYRAVHIYVKSKNCTINRTVEIQLRTFEQHYWSTLVEIVDVVFDTAIKTGDRSVPELNEFLKLYSERGFLSLDNKFKLIQIEDIHKIYNQLNETFRRNLVNLRMTWEDLKTYSNNAYVVFEVDQDTKEASYNVFEEFEDAEQYYFEKFRNTNGDLLVAHLGISNFKQLAAAYSNYVLTNHDFQDSWIEFCTNSADKFIDEFRLFELMTVSTSIRNMFANINEGLDSDSDDIDEQFNSKKINVNQFLKLNEWLAEREEAQKIRIEKFEALQRKLQIKIDELTKENPMKEFFKSILPWNWIK